ncbi:hypothetical protein ACRRTK_003002 [Alexandromys fortis]
MGPGHRTPIVKFLFSCRIVFSNNDDGLINKKLPKELLLRGEGSVLVHRLLLICCGQGAATGHTESSACCSAPMRVLSVQYSVPDSGLPVSVSEGVPQAHVGAVSRDLEIFSFLDIVTLCRCAQISKGRVVENISKRCGGFLRKLSLRGCIGVGDSSLNRQSCAAAVSQGICCSGESCAAAVSRDLLQPAVLCSRCQSGDLLQRGVLCSRCQSGSAAVGSPVQPLSAGICCSGEFCAAAVRGSAAAGSPVQPLSGDLLQPAVLCSRTVHYQGFTACVHLWMDSWGLSHLLGCR